MPTETKPKIPKGWRVVKRGNILKGDRLFWTDEPSCNKWEDAWGIIGWKVHLASCIVIRPVKSPAKRRK